MNRTPARPRTSPQSGYATLTMAVVLLIIMSLMTVYLTRSGIVDMRTAGNKIRYNEALASAELNLNTGIGWMLKSSNRSTYLTSDQLALWATCDNAPSPYSQMGATWACSQPTGVTTFYLATPANPPAPATRGSIYFVLATGTSVDGSASATVKEGVYFTGSAGQNPAAAPMMGTGNVPLNGNFSVVANPNGGGTGVPVSIWSKAVINTPSGSSATCQIQEYTTNGDCTTSSLSSSSGKGKDIVDNDPNFPSDLFSYIFGVPTADYGSVKAQATQLTDCSTLSAATTGIVWVTGSCSIPNGAAVGGPNLILVVQGGDVTLNANSTFTGLLFSFDPSGNTGTIKANGGATFNGSMLSNNNVTMGININGTFNMIYQQIGANGSGGASPFKLLARIPGSWADYLQ